MKHFIFLFVFVFIPLSVAQKADDLTQIRYQGDYVIIPENRLGEFFRNYKPKENVAFSKPNGDYIKDGYVFSTLTTEPLEGIEVTLQLYDGITLIDTIGPALTNSQGYYTFTITDVEDINETANIGEIRYSTVITPTIELNLGKISRVEIKLFNVIGQEIKTLLAEETSHKFIHTNIEDLSSGLYILQIIIDGKLYSNKILKTENSYCIGKTKEQIVKAKDFKKTTGNLTVAREFQDPNNQYHKYSHGEVEPYAYTFSQDFTLFPRLNLEQMIVDPEYTVIDTIKTYRDLVWYEGRIQAYNDNWILGGDQMFWPIKLFVDSSNAPLGWVPEIRNVIQYYRDSIDIHPDSLIMENPVYTLPDYSNGYSAINIVYTDSSITGERTSFIQFWVNGNPWKFMGGFIYIDTIKVTNTIDAGKHVARLIEMYVTALGVNDINHQGYLSYTNHIRTGPKSRPNNDEKKFIKMIRFSRRFYMNLIFP